MSFFNITQLGPQNPVKVVKGDNGGDKKAPEASSEVRTPPIADTHQHARQEDTLKIPNLRSMTYNPDASSQLPYKGSHKLFSEKRMKHQRHHKGDDHFRIVLDGGEMGYLLLILRKCTRVLYMYI